MAVEVILPRVDMDMAEGRIARWLVAEGETVAQGQPIFEIETDKAAMEIEAPAAGVIRGLAPAGDAPIPVGRAVARIVPPGDAAGQAHGADPAGAALADARADQERTGDSAADRTPVAATAAGAADPIIATPRDDAAPETVDASRRDPLPPMEPAAAAQGVRATPAARRLAREVGAALAAIQGSGPSGRVQRDDVAAALARRDAAPTPAGDRRLPPAADGLSSPAVAPSPVTRAGGPDGLVAGIAFRTLRAGDGAPVALIHGFGAEGAAWRPFAGRLALANPVVALDLPSHGGSAAVEGGLEALVGRVEAALLDAGLNRLHLVGHSLGGAVAAALAAAGALDVASLTLLAPAGLGARIDRDFLEAFLAAETEGALTVAMRRLVADPADLPPGLVRATLRARAARGTDALARLAAALFPGGAQGFGIVPALARLSCPVRVVTGLADAILPPPSLGALPPAAALHGLPGVGHLPQVERADLVARLVAETVRSAG